MKRPRHRRLRHLMDWRLILATAAAILAVAVVVLAFQSRAAKDQQIADLIQDGRDQDKAAAISREQASQERQALLTQAQRLTRLYRDLLAKQTALLEYLEREGIQVPQVLADRKSSGPARPESGRSSASDGKSSGAIAPDGSNGGAAAPPNTPGPGGPGAPSPAPGPPAPGPPTPVRDLLDELLKGLP